MSSSRKSDRSIADTPAILDIAELSDMLERVDAAELGTRISRARDVLGMSQSEAASGLISNAYLSRIESGKRRPTMKVLRAIAQRVESTPHELLLGLTPNRVSAGIVELDWAFLALKTGDPDGALAKVQEILATAPPASHFHHRARFLTSLALEAKGDYAGATVILEDLVEEGDGGGEPSLEFLTTLSRCYRQGGELGRAIEVGRRAEEYLKDLGLEGTSEGVRLTLNVAAAHAESGDLAYAARLCQRALKHADSLSTAAEQAGCYWNASIIESRRGNNDEAVALGRQALRVLATSESERGIAHLRTQLGILHLRLSPPQIEEALQHLKTAENQLLISNSSPADMADNWLAQARAAFLSGDLIRAEQDATDCLENAAGCAPLVAAEVHTLLGQVAFARGLFEDAKGRYQQAILVLSGLGADRGAAQLWYDLGALLMSVGSRDEALDAFMRAGTSTGLRTSALVDSGLTAGPR